jgi:hypothetical protein
VASGAPAQRADRCSATGRLAARPAADGACGRAAAGLDRRRSARRSDAGARGATELRARLRLAGVELGVLRSLRTRSLDFRRTRAAASAERRRPALRPSGSCGCRELRPECSLCWPS